MLQSLSITVTILIETTTKIYVNNDGVNKITNSAKPNHLLKYATKFKNKQSYLRDTNISEQASLSLDKISLLSKYGTTTCEIMISD